MKYKLLKIIAILMSPMFLHLGILTADKLSAGDYSTGYFCLLLGMCLYALDAWIFWYLIEQRGKQ